tara:strand:+ start:2251 stop:2619 length:369 start_codon:yes stop_codon:yes gene_type:complete
MFNCERDPLTLLVELTPKLAKRRYRQSIYEAWDYCCGYCNEPATSLDHIIPKFNSGSSYRNNLIPACRSCNANKASLKMEEWYKQQTFFDEIKLEKIKKWTSEDVSDLLEYTRYSNRFSFAS